MFELYDAGWHSCACVFLSYLRARAAVYLSCCVRRWVFAVRWVPRELLDTAVSGTVARVLSMLIACTHRCILELRHTTVCPLSVSRLWFELYYAAVSVAAAPARAAHSVCAVGYSLGGGVHLGCWIRWYPLFLLGCCFELYDAAVSGAAVLALSADCVHKPLCIRFAVVLFSQNPGHLVHLFIYLHLII